jgi:hypothetical protein
VTQSRIQQIVSAVTFDSKWCRGAESYADTVIQFSPPALILPEFDDFLNDFVNLCAPSGTEMHLFAPDE